MQRSIGRTCGSLTVEKSESVITPKKKITTSIENIVASVVLNQRFDLVEIAATMPNVEFDPETFPGLVYRLKKPKTATLIFTTGKMVCTGAKSVKESRRAVHKIVKNLNKAGIRITGTPEITIQNIVASGGLGFPVDLERLVMTLENCIYEPEQFPGLIHRMKDPKTVILVFGSGKIVITGAKLEEQIPEAAMKLMNRVLDLESMWRPDVIRNDLRDRGLLGGESVGH
ncbi:MAG: TATA-box-binding protein [Candidatus Thorarchaeota archaeon]|nr:TATA-box-binding protein [Candidatus Thorarchaeota archaeon]